MRMSPGRQSDPCHHSDGSDCEAGRIHVHSTLPHNTNHSSIHPNISAGMLLAASKFRLLKEADEDTRSLPASVNLNPRTLTLTSSRSGSGVGL